MKNRSASRNAAAYGSARSAVALLAAAAVLAAMALLQSCGIPGGDPAPERYALVVGIDDYASTNDLKWMDDDRRDMKNLLESQGWNVREAGGMDAFFGNIRLAMEAHFADIPEDATALFFFSGHGTALDGDPSNISAIAPYDFMPDEWAPLITPEILYAWIEEYIPTDNVFIIIDACNSGGFVFGEDSIDALGSSYSPEGRTIGVTPLAGLADFGELLARNAAQSGRLSPIVISAAGPGELSWEDNVLENGVFTDYLLESASAGDSNGDGYVTGTEAYRHAADRVKEEWNDKTVWASERFYPHLSGGLRDMVLFRVQE